MQHAAAAWASLSVVRERAPLIHNITNLVSMDVVANCLLALGASPAMAHAEEEAADFALIASALVVNLGTLSPPWIASMEKAAAQARAQNKPWVLDPVGAGATPYRTRTATELAALGPRVIRANASEVLALAGAAAGPTRGVDSSHATEAAIGAAQELARELGTVIAVTGAVDHITDGRRLLKVRNGDALMTRVTGLGCAASAIVAAFLAVADDPAEASAHALAVFGHAGERAAAASAGPGSFRWQIIDRLARLDETTVLDGVRIE